MNESITSRVAWGLALTAAYSASLAMVLYVGLRAYEFYPHFVQNAGWAVLGTGVLYIIYGLIKENHENRKIQWYEMDHDYYPVERPESDRD